MKFFKNTKEGFTLIELLVVVAIIGLLSSIVLSSLNSARGKGRDAKRMSDVHQLKIALEYYFDANGFYPSIGTDNSGYAVSGLTATLSPYIKQIPDDPLGSSYAWQYVRGDVSSNSYGLWIYFEKTSARCVSGVGTNPGWWSSGLNGFTCPF